MLAETTYYRPETMFCRKKAAEGAFGQFVYAEGEYFHDMSHGLYEVLRNRWGAEFGPDKTGDPPMFYPTHSTSGIISVMKARMVEVSAMGYVQPNDDWFRTDTIWRNPFCNQVALFRMSNGQLHASVSSDELVMSVGKDFGFTGRRRVLSGMFLVRNG